MKNKILSITSVRTILHWLSLFFSYKKLPNAYENINEPIATGGFPLKIFEYPVPPMGNDWPPTDTWPTFFLNLGVWIIIGLIISLILGKKTEDKKILKIINTSAIILSILGMFYITLKFD